MHPEPHGVRRRLQHRDHPAAGAARTQRFDGGLDRGRVMGEVVVDRDPRHRRAVFEPPPDA